LFFDDVGNEEDGAAAAAAAAGFAGDAPCPCPCFKNAFHNRRMGMKIQVSSTERF